jgi:hypothetical protein
MFVKPNLTSKAQENQSNVIVRDVNDFKYPVSRFNIGFKANLIDLEGKEGLKVMISKGQALPFTITCDAQSGEVESMVSSWLQNLLYLCINSL